ncbi:hypothetical protein LY76DRAFT_418567 [Colletotrichum caudatum]|nr:hypothetical protein LY76DRAFT_418567 [Colletotrichum caudatum]
MWHSYIRGFSPWTFIFPSIEGFLSLAGAVTDDGATGVANETQEINNLLPRHAFPRHDGTFRRKPTLMALVVSGPGEHSQLGNTGELASQVGPRRDNPKKGKHSAAEAETPLWSAMERSKDKYSTPALLSVTRWSKSYQCLYPELPCMLFVSQTDPRDH